MQSLFVSMFTILVVCVCLLIDRCNSTKHVSTELKDYIVERWALSDETLHAYCIHIGYPHSTVHGWVKRYEQYGTCASNSELTGIETRGRNRLLTQRDILICFEIVANHPEYFYDEIADELATRGGTVVQPLNIQRAFTRLKITNKKIWKLSLHHKRNMNCKTLFTLSM